MKCNQLVLLFVLFVCVLCEETVVTLPFVTLTIPSFTFPEPTTIMVPIGDKSTATLTLFETNFDDKKTATDGETTTTATNEPESNDARILTPFLAYVFRLFLD